MINSFRRKRTRADKAAPHKSTYDMMGYYPVVDRGILGCQNVRCCRGALIRSGTYQGRSHNCHGAEENSLALSRNQSYPASALVRHRLSASVFRLSSLRLTELCSSFAQSSMDSARMAQPRGRSGNLLLGGNQLVRIWVTRLVSLFTSRRVFPATCTIFAVSPAEGCQAFTGPCPLGNGSVVILNLPSGFREPPPGSTTGI
jgi:hypothetical protein